MELSLLSPVIDEKHSTMSIQYQLKVRQVIEGWSKFKRLFELVP